MTKLTVNIKLTMLGNVILTAAAIAKGVGAKKLSRWLTNKLHKDYSGRYFKYTVRNRDKT